MRHQKNKRGQVALEASIAFTVTLVFLASVISAIDYYRTDILMRRAVEQTCERMSLLYPVSVPSSDLMSAAVNAFPDMGIGDTNGAAVLSKASSVGMGIDEATGHTLKELILQGIFSKTMENQIRKAFVERNGGSHFFEPKDIEVFFNISDSHHVIEVTTDYTVVTIAGRKERSIYSVIPLYGEPVLNLNASQSEKNNIKKDNIWSLSNFDRGDSFRELYGANLPKTFPVIDSVEGGKVTAIRSIDLTSPYYQDTTHIEKKIISDIKAIKGFEPQSARINGKTYSVDRVDSRYLKVVIPKNSGSIGRETVENLKGYAFVQGVILEIDEYETSEKYSGK